MALAQQPPETPGEQAPPPRTAPASATPVPPPPPPPNTRERFVKDDEFSIGIFAFQASGLPFLGKGHAAIFTDPGALDFGGKNQVAPGVNVSIPAGKGGDIQLSYFQVRGVGETTTPVDSAFWSVAFAKGDALETSYKLRTGKISWNYLTYPFPSTQGKLRLKTLWEVTAAEMRTRVYANQKATTDANGNYVEVTGEGDKTVLLPTLGLALEDRISPHFRWEIKASGMMYPRRAHLWNTDAYIGYRRKSLEFVVGGKGFGFKSSPRKEQFLKERLVGGFVGINWYL